MSGEVVLGQGTGAQHGPKRAVVTKHNFPSGKAASPEKEKKKVGRRASKRARTAKSFPPATFEEALTIARAIHQYAAGQKIRRLTLFEKLGKAPDSGPSRQMITTSSKYGLTQGGYQADHLELTNEGRLATDPDAPRQEQMKAGFKLAIEGIAPYKLLYERFKGNKLPTQAVMHDLLRDEGYRDEEVAECVDTFILNAKFLGLLTTIAGAERLLPIEHILEETIKSPETPKSNVGVSASGAPATSEAADWGKICFYITPIGEQDSEQRKHSDLFLNHIVEPALNGTGLKVVRADQIGKPGMIGAQVVEHVLKARLVIADLSFHNPNVFYELSLRHAVGLPTVQLIRESDKVPFDLDQFRTIRIDTTDIYALVPKLETHRSEIATQVRGALQSNEVTDNPLTVFFPGLKVSVG